MSAALDYHLGADFGAGPTNSDSTSDSTFDHTFDHAGPHALRDSAPALALLVLVPERTVVAEPLTRVAVLTPPAQARSAAPVRLTRRGVLAMSVLVAACCTALLWLAIRSAPSATGPTIAPASVTVRAGDTLWSIASRIAPQRDPRAEVAVLQRANHLDDVELVPGQVLRVP